MKLLWLCNSAPGVVRSHATGKNVGAVNWVDHVLSGLRQRGFTIRILCRGNGGEGTLDETCSYRYIGEDLPYVCSAELEEQFRQELRTFQPEVIHSWGVEYGHALAMVNAAEQEGMLDRMAASIQGLCAVLAEHYTDGIPEKVQKKSSFRDFLRKDNIRQQQEKFCLRGQLECQTVKKLHHVIGRTRWDREHTARWNPEVCYHFCNETLREDFYTGQWRYEDCRKHRIFASSCAYPIKGFHSLLEAFAEVRKEYPDATLAVTGRSFLTADLKAKLRRGSYEAYLAKLAKRLGVAESVEFLGSLSASGMKEAYLNANVFVLPSTMENSPNSLGEAMLLGVPCVAADVGGVRDLMAAEEGRIYPSGDTAALAAHIKAVFALEDKAAEMGRAASAHARKTHDPEKNLQDLMKIYEELA